ncbi:ubiquitin-associated domain-containing protein 2 [Erpetoichthys calabaricus]|uniref:UBA domain containing 2 n=1 Tax=Erpetoichthys calabaricus TaxID=27687 RepID=A0A8C4XBB4_ERPCA|nr:ubiquitin-associated domain-containing protein 2 [Erpetoichthys calabaricus]
MFTATSGSSGLYKAPLTKSLLLVPTILAFLLVVLLPQYQNFFVYDLQLVIRDLRIWRLISSRLIYLDVKDAFCGSLLIYNFRVFERRYGSKKYASFLFGMWILSAVFELLLTEAMFYVFHINMDILPSGFLAPIFAFFVPFYHSIPRIQVTQLLGQFAVTNKSLVYLIGLQLLLSSAFMWIIALSGLISGMFYFYDMFQIQNIIFIPNWLAQTSSFILEPLFSSAEPTHESSVGMGATLDIQRQQRMDLLDQQMLISQFSQARRRERQQGGFAQWNRFLFPLQRRRNLATLSPPLSAQNNPSGVSEDQVARLMEMGFSRQDALEALQASNNDINMATNFLLQH